MAEVPLRMPKLSMTMEEGEFNNWLVSVGETITKGAPIAVVMTDKVEMEVESEVDGTVTRLTAQEGDVIPVGEPLGYAESKSDEGLGDLEDLLGPSDAPPPRSTAG
jgi:pyruvate dehydrogenase E2 component (dihydrolipoamide acetyltransferase)